MSYTSLRSVLTALVCVSAIAVLSLPTAGWAHEKTGSLLVSVQSDGNLAVVAVGGTDNDVTAIGEDVSDALVPVVPGAGCDAVSANQVRCPGRPGRIVHVSLGAGNDRGYIRNFGAGNTLQGGGGDDTLYIHDNGGGHISGGAGDDDIGMSVNDNDGSADGGKGNDTMNGFNIAWGTWSGGDGDDSITIATNHIRVDLGGLTLRGGEGNDFLTMRESKPSNAVLSGGQGDDVIIGDDGADTITCGNGQDAYAVGGPDGPYSTPFSVRGCEVPFTAPWSGAL